MQQCAEQLGRLAGITRLQRGLRLGQQIRGRHAPARELQQPLDEAPYLGFGQRALEKVGDLTLPKSSDRRYGLQGQPELGKLLHERTVGINVDFHELEPACRCPDDLLQHRRELLAGPAPGGPEIDDHRHLPGRVHHLPHEGLLVAIYDHGGAWAAALGSSGGAWLLPADDQVVHLPRLWLSRSCVG